MEGILEGRRKKREWRKGRGRGEKEKKNTKGR